MAIMKWGTPPKGTTEDRRAHVVGHGENVSLQHEAFGSHVAGSGGQITDLNENHALATRWSTAPYRGDEEVEFGLKAPPNPHGYRDASRVGKCMANNDTCNGNATHASGSKWCWPHSRTMDKSDQ
jgi:hypothetical protein